MHGQKKNGPITEESFLRNMPYTPFRKITDEMNLDDMWKRVAEKIPMNAAAIYGQAEFEPRYTIQNMMRFSAKNQRPGNSAAKAMLIDWATQNVRIKDFLAILHQCQLWRLADYIVKDVLGYREGAVQRCLDSLLRSLPSVSSDSSTAFVRNVLQEVSNIESPLVAESLLDNNPLTGFVPLSSASVSDDGTLEERFSQTSGPKQSDGVKAGAPPLGDESSTTPLGLRELSLEDVGDHYVGDDAPPNLHLLKLINYPILNRVTNSFDSRHITEGGRVIGEGGFGKVYLGLFQNGFKVAVKALKDESEETLDQFKTEVETLCTFKHPNIVLLLGYSIGGENRCLIYEYMVNGSLEERLACRFDTPPLSAAMRFEIIRGTARGIAFLNNDGLTHRDIKSANILLDDEFTPKVADFATARLAPTGETNDVMKTNVVIGTSVYLAPEAFYFEVSPKLDAFSFGVVILEVLTGLPVLDSDRDEEDIKYHVMEHCTPADDDDEEEPGTIHDLLDPKAGSWDNSVVDQLFKVANRCLENISSRRVTVPQILPELESLVPPLGEPTPLAEHGGESTA